MTDTLGLGKLITTPQQRDAIHIAVAPVTAGERLYGGQSITLRDGMAYAEEPAKAIGIVDPFLQQAANREQQFWMWLKPYTITSLRHDWTHPAFKDDAVSSEMWLRVFAENHCIDYRYMMQEISTSGFVCFGVENYREDCDDVFWDHVEKVLGRKTDRDTSNFRCAC